MEKQTLQIRGMSCAHCVKAVSGALSGLASVANVKVDLKSGAASFSHDPAKAGIEAIKAAIVDAGFEV